MWARLKLRNVYQSHSFHSLLHALGDCFICFCRPSSKFACMSIGLASPAMKSEVGAIVEREFWHFQPLPQRAQSDLI